MFELIDDSLKDLLETGALLEIEIVVELLLQEYLLIIEELLPGAIGTLQLDVLTLQECII